MALQGSEAAREFTDKKGESWVGASAPVKKLGGAIISQQTRKEAYAASDRGKLQAGWAVLITILIASFIAFLLARSLVKPLLAINRFAGEVDLANNQFPNPINIGTHDEIQEVADTFNSMIKKLK